MNDFEVKEDLESFCTETLSTISPALVLVTGQSVDVSVKLYSDHIPVVEM